jgi:hypothetical protein
MGLSFDIVCGHARFPQIAAKNYKSDKDEIFSPVRLSVYNTEATNKEYP